VECFFVEAEHGIIQVYDVENGIRHFKLNQIERVEIRDIDWENEKEHSVKSTDVFRIADDKQTSRKESQELK